MDKFLKAFFFTFSLTLTTCLSANQPQNINFVPAPPKVEVKSYVLMDYDSGQILAEFNGHQKFEPASLTKMMTMYALDHDINIGRVKLTDQVLISQKARQVDGSRMYLEENSHVPLADLIKGIIIQSGNDASIAAAEHCAGDEKTFTELMNFYAKNLGMNNTHFSNATGLPEDNHYSSAHDLALLSRALIKEFPTSYSVYSEKTFSHNNINQNNRNRLLWENAFVDGIKTGMTNSAGYCLASSAKKNNRRLIAVVLGAPSEKLRSYESLRLLQYGFRFFQSHLAIRKNQVLSKQRIWMGDNKFIDVGTDEDIYVALPTGSAESLTIDINFEPSLTAPIVKGQKLGTIYLSIGDKIYKKVPALALTGSEKGSTFARLQDNVKLTVTKFIDKITP
jgi:D-alanyl-D-alanine carboxypeptidase (penicillin-binding protein 5/6)